MRALRKGKLCVAGALLAGNLFAQTPAPPVPDNPESAPTPHGQIIIQSHGEPPAPDASAAAPSQTQPAEPVLADNAKADISDEQRGALTFTRYDLDARINPAHSGLNVRAEVVVRNDSAAPLREIPLQISSTLRWESATLVEGSRRIALPLAQHRLDTDADHTGAATEAVLPLPEPLAPGASVALDLFYAGTIAQDAGRLTRLHASTSQGQSADWDGIGPRWTGLRGFGDVLWYPVASPQLFLQEGNSLFKAVGQMRLREQSAAIRLRLSVAYEGEPPVAAYFCGRRAELHAVADDPNVATASGAGIATAEFPAEPLGFRQPSLFLIRQQELLLGGAGPEAATGTVAAAPAAVSSSNPDAASPTAPAASVAGPIVALESTDPGASAGLGAAADRAASLLVEWLGPRPLSALTLLDHEGQPFQDGPLLVAPAAALETSVEAPALVYSLTHAWVQTGQPWMDEGLAQFFALLWVERENGRAAALAQMTELLEPVTLAEPDLTGPTDTKPGQPLIAASDELFYRRKAAAVWWMLRDLAGEQALRSALAAWRTQPAMPAASAQAEAIAFEHLLEERSGKDLGWFFADWVLRDRGLPDLSIADVQSSPTIAGAGHNAGWLVAVTVRNEGGATADVPLIVHSGQFSTASRIRVPGFSHTTQRVLVESAPTGVTVNDGSTPEQRVAMHSRQLSAHTQ